MLTSKFRTKVDTDAMRRAVRLAARTELTRLSRSVAAAMGKTAVRELQAAMRTAGSGKLRADRPRRSADLKRGEIPREQAGRLAETVKAGRPKIRIMGDTARVSVQLYVGRLAVSRIEATLCRGTYRRFSATREFRLAVNGAVKAALARLV